MADERSRNVPWASVGNERAYGSVGTTAVQAAEQRPGLGSQAGQLVPQLRVMSPTSGLAMREGHSQIHPCKVCNMSLGGPLVICAACGQPVHSHCSLAVMHNSICEKCMRDFQNDELARQQQAAAAHQLGLVSARGAQLLGTAAGAVGAASLAASRYLVAGAQAGATHAWRGARAPSPSLDVTVPRPASLPPPLADDPPVAPRSPIVAEVAEGSRGSGPEQQQRAIHNVMELESQARAAADAAAEQRHQQLERKSHN